jgi:hypothetical protein
MLYNKSENMQVEIDIKDKNGKSAKQTLYLHGSSADKKLDIRQPYLFFSKNKVHKKEVKGKMMEFPEIELPTGKIVEYMTLKNGTKRPYVTKPYTPAQKAQRKKEKEERKAARKERRVAARARASLKDPKLPVNKAITEAREEKAKIRKQFEKDMKAATEKIAKKVQAKKNRLAGIGGEETSSEPEAKAAKK